MAQLISHLLNQKFSSSEAEKTPTSIIMLIALCTIFLVTPTPIQYISSLISYHGLNTEKYLERFNFEKYPIK